ncbi:Lipoate-protein ligase A [Natronoarchaeum philippinense]|uniref:Lipoate-protein ligase A n=1 Tax=Natronoarchaeum philippinense TaxID=558529 RepID=A0A285NRE3_NATPI|nr:lipoate--protein ligase family protein [Natronoarchaeum philippinense]SNZ12045.1 Lipoate-protein ligase A [Natronoarchaeum philippinense]
MRVLRGRAATPEADRDATAELLERAGETGEPALRVWRPHRQIAFGRRDATAEGYDLARSIAREHGFEPIERSVGGRAVAYTGTTLAVAHARPIEDVRQGLEERYGDALDRLGTALGRLGVDAEPGEPPNSFCPGTHSLQVAGRKVAGVAQRVKQNAALVAAVVVVDGRKEIADVLDPIYDALDVPFDPDTVGSVAGAGGPADPERVARTIEDAIAGDRATTVEYLSESHFRDV